MQPRKCNALHRCPDAEVDAISQVRRAHRCFLSIHFPCVFSLNGMQPVAWCCLCRLREIVHMMYETLHETERQTVYMPAAIAKLMAAPTDMLRRKASVSAHELA